MISHPTAVGIYCLNLPHGILTLKMEAARSLEALIPIYQTAKQSNPIPERQ
jgi:hypothetical protein